MQTKQPWYISLRAEALAIVYLTDRDDLIVSQQQQSTGLDLLVTITKDGNSSGRLFGVQVKAVASSSELIQHNDIVKIKINKFNHLDKISDLPFPVCLFFFTLDNDQGYYKWILEPNIDGKDSINLLFNNSAEMRRIDEEEIEKIISRVNSWYEKRNKKLV